MLLTLVDSLRCPAPHEESSLVLTVESWTGPRVAEGLLGCPICHARYPIHRGAANFSSRPAPVRRAVPGEDADAMRLAAQLALTEPGGVILLTGRYSTAHEALTSVIDVTCLLVDAAESLSPRAVNMMVADRLPLVDRVLRGAALEGEGTRLIRELERCVRPGGRIVAPLSTAGLPTARIVAEDAVEWVAELISQPAIQLQKRDVRKV
jgi:hypothetical protein